MTLDTEGPNPDLSRSRRPRTLGGAVFLGVVMSTAFGLGIVLAGSWRIGLIVLGSGLFLGGLARLVIPEGQAGMLRVRRRLADTAFMILVGAAIVAVAITIHNPSFA